MVPADDMFQQKTDEKSMTYHIFDIADDILIVGYDTNSKDHHKTPKWIMQLCQQENLKLNKNATSGVLEYNFLEK